MNFLKEVILRMHISWKFLDKRKAAIEAIEAYNSMNFIIKHTADKIQEVRSRMGGATSPKLDGLPSVHNPQSRENMLLNSIDEIDMLEERYRQAVEYMEWFKPAWEQLSEEDRFILETFFMKPDACTNAALIISDHLNVERSSVYRKKNRLLEKITTLLYGKN